MVGALTDDVAELGAEVPKCWACWKQATSYCDGAPAALYAFPPVPPLVLLIPGSLNTDPGELAELPGRVVAENVVQSWLGGPGEVVWSPPGFNNPDGFEVPIR